MEKLKLLQDWTDTEGKAFKSGDVIEADESTAKGLIDLKIASKYDEAAEKIAEEIAEKNSKAISEQVAQGVKDAVANMSKNNSNINIHVVADQVDKELDGYTLSDNLMDIKDFQLGSRSKTKLLEAMEQKTVDATGLQETVDSEGGFLVGSDFLAEIGTLMHESAALVNRTRRIPIGPDSNRLVWMQVDESTRVDGSRRGGVTVARTHEAVSSTVSAPTFRKQTLELEKLTGHFAMTEELAQDKVALGNMVRTFFAEEFAFIFDSEIIRGTGTGEAQGILNADALISVGAEVGQAVSTVVKENIDNMWARMWAPSLPRGEWFINQDVWPQLLQLNQAVGTGGAPVFIPGGNIAAAPFGSLYGRPISPIEHASTLGTQGDIMFLDLTQYWTIEKGGINAAASIHVRFLQGEELIRFTMRNNGQSNWRTALTPNQGSNTQSPFVVLDTRS